MKKVISLIMAIIMLASLVTGCRKPESSNKTDSSPTKSLTNDTVTYDSSKPSWKQDTTPIELEWFVAYDWATINFDPVNNLFDKYIYDNTGIKIKFTIGSVEKLNTLIATNSLPDIVTYDAISSERLVMENGGMLLPLDELKDKYAPDIKVPQGMIDWYSNENDKHWYALVGYFEDLKDAYARGSYIPSHNMNFARQDIMNDLGIDSASMQTKEGFLDALRKVKEANIQYNGQTVIPYIGDDVECLAEQMGVDREDKDGNLLNIKRQPEFLEALQFLNQIYREGLTTDEIFTMDNVLRKQLVSSGAVFAGTRHNYLNGKDALFYSDPKALMVGVGPLVGDAGKDSILSPSPTAGWAANMITKNCKNPARAASLLAFLTQEDISLSYYYGGIDGYDIVNGEAIVKSEREKERSEDFAAFDAKYRSTLQDLVCDYVWVMKYAPKTNLDAYATDTLNYTNKWIKGHIFDDKIFTDVEPQNNTDLSAISAQLNQYWGQQFPQIVMAPSKEEATKIYNETIKQMEEMGMAQLDEFKNERFHKNKEKMGVQFAWPRNIK